MSQKYEQWYALKKTQDFLRLLMTKDCPIRKKELREKAYSCLRHFPPLHSDTGEPMFSQDSFPSPFKKEDD